MHVEVLADITENIIAENANLKCALEQLGSAPVQVLLVVDGQGRFVAALTDGDVRRAILAGAGLETRLSEVAHYNPIYLTEDSRAAVEALFDETKICALPILDPDGKIRKIYATGYVRGKNPEQKINVPVVIMAGGKGTRLYPYTKILPKPLIPVADTPISERIIRSFQKAGCEEFYMTINYRKNMIKAYFNDLDNGYRIHFAEETEPLGTGGGLRLLKRDICGTFVLTNCDILLMEDVRNIVEHHRNMKNDLTMVCSLKNFEIPYGIVNFSEGGEISSFEEKPKMSFFTNTGYYVLEPRIFEYIEENERIDMPDVIERMRRDGRKIGVYPIGENSWLDMGQFDSMESMERKLRELGND